MKLRPFVAAIALAACAPATQQGAANPPVRSTVSQLAPTSPASTRWADSVLATLSPRDRVAQLVWPWMLGDYVPEGSAEWGRIKRLITEDHVGGIIISVGSPLEIATKLNALQRLSNLPLLVSADLETGVGFRVRGGYFVPNAIDLGGATNFPWQMALGAADDLQLSYQLGRVTAREGRALGIHIAYNPVLDVNNNPANPVIGARSFGETAPLTSRHGVAVIKGLQEHGMLATGKHFPGHGDTETNSHLALATVSASRARLDSLELAPFKAAIDAGVGAIMTFHGYLPALDPGEIPATLSPAVMTGLLRRELKFNGLLISDAMDMRGVVDKFGPEEAAKRAIAAGNDVLLMPADIRRTIDAVMTGLSEGRYPASRIEEAARRVLELKHRFSLHHERTVALDRVREVVGDSSHQAAASRIAERSFVLARDDRNAVPLAASSDGGKARVLSITYARRNDLGAGGAFTSELGRGARVQPVYLNADDPEPNVQRMLEAATQADAVILSSYVNITSETASAAAPQALIEFTRQLMATRKPLIVVSFGTPYLLNQLPFVETYAVAWGGTTASQRAAARALIGEIPIRARLPISIPPLIRAGAGIERGGR